MAYNSERDNEALAAVIQVIAARTAIAIIGAGVSAPLGYPVWGDLVTLLAFEVERRTGPVIEVDGLTMPVSKVKDLNALVAAKLLKAALGPAYVGIMRDVYGPREQHDGALQILVKLPIQHFVTANYDPSLERAHERANAPFRSIVGYEDEFRQMITHINDGQRRERVIFHAHGRYDQPASIVLTEDDYGALYTNSRVTEPLWNLAQARQFVFFGFSLKDLDLMRGFVEAKRMLNFGCRHYAVLDLEDNAEAQDNEIKRRLEARERFGIEPIFYLRKERDFATGYTRTLEIIKQGVDSLLETPRPAPEIVPVEVAPDSAERDAQKLTALSNNNIGRRAVGDLE